MKEVKINHPYGCAYGEERTTLFSLLEKNSEDEFTSVLPVTRCRDILMCNLIVVLNPDIESLSHSYPKQRTLQKKVVPADAEKVYILAINENLKGWLDNTLSILNDVERKIGFHETKVVAIDKNKLFETYRTSVFDKDKGFQFVFEIDKQWFETPYVFQMFIMIVRSLSYFYNDCGDVISILRTNIPDSKIKDLDFNGNISYGIKEDIKQCIKVFNRFIDLIQEKIIINQPSYNKLARNEHHHGLTGFCYDEKIFGKKQIINRYEKCK